MVEPQQSHKICLFIKYSNFGRGHGLLVKNGYLSGSGLISLSNFIKTWLDGNMRVLLIKTIQTKMN